MALELRCLVAVFMHVFYSSCFCAICLSGGFQPEHSISYMQCPPPVID